MFAVSEVNVCNICGIYLILAVSTRLKCSSGWDLWLGSRLLDVLIFGNSEYDSLDTFRYDDSSEILMILLTLSSVTLLSITISHWLPPPQKRPNSHICSIPAFGIKSLCLAHTAPRSHETNYKKKEFWECELPSGFENSLRKGLAVFQSKEQLNTNMTTKIMQSGREKSTAKLKIFRIVRCLIMWTTVIFLWRKNLGTELLSINSIS